MLRFKPNSEGTRVQSPPELGDLGAFPDSCRRSNVGGWYDFSNHDSADYLVKLNTRSLVCAYGATIIDLCLLT